ncbi:MAG: hypothetical protein WA277_05275 [Nitrospirota bacterium]
MKRILFALITIMLLSVSFYAFAEEKAAEKIITGFKNPESIAYNKAEKVLYMSEFGSGLKPTEKDGAGSIRKLSLKGETIEERFLPDPKTKMVLNKPKGIAVKADKLWVTDIDVLWEFNLDTKEGKKISLEGAQFLNDVIIRDNTLYVSDTQGDQIFQIEPADYLSKSHRPTIKVIAKGKGLSPNGLCGEKGNLYVAGYDFGGSDRGLYSVSAKEDVKTLLPPFGQLDGIAHTKDGKYIFFSDWKTKSLYKMKIGGKPEAVATGFEGPADFALWEDDKGIHIAIPDLAKSEMRLIDISK